MSEANPGKVMTTREFLKLDREAKQREEDRKKFFRDQASAWAYAKRIGREEARKEILFSIVPNMLRMGLSVAVIAQATGMTESEIERIKHNKE
ncbi:hypothetical protein QWJ34_20190 [Saccharibacillus sp. CPCC 101409]|uniref:hypothetical protein n=1 Tax=Saccharibacillus sp. CPCC 101409 TaxID=3058041 RepID=UPI0026731C51|nr:hypothetical protein [Saccharibacillus sp. CPCC 101409]MDO3412094.1 hypothetical protein [Saccharibacillus sp. CPCC 101409]